MQCLLRLLLCLYYATMSRAFMLFANVKAWDEVANANLIEEAPLTNEELQLVFDSVWSTLRINCPSIPRDGPLYVDVGIDDRLMNSDYPDYERVLGWASRNERLLDGLWKGMLSTQERLDLMLSGGYTHLGTVRVGRNVVGGWFRGSSSVCSHKFRLEDVLQHEILHLLGISSTVREDATGKLHIGDPYAGVCFPGEFDSHIHDVRGKLLVKSNCDFTESSDGNYYANGVRLFVSEHSFLQGTTMSHVHNKDAALSPYVYACDPAGPIQLKYEDAKVLRAIGVTCNTNALPHSTTLDYGGSDDPSTEQTQETVDPDDSGSSRKAWSQSLVASATLVCYWFAVS